MIGLNKQAPDVAVIHLASLAERKIKTQWREVINPSTTKRIRSGLDHPDLSIGSQARIADQVDIVITGIRYQRLQDISEEEARAEGVECVGFEPMINFGGTELYKDYLHDGWGCWTAKESFKSLVISIHGEKFWNKNGWVWVIEFKALDNEELEI